MAPPNLLGPPELYHAAAPVSLQPTESTPSGDPFVDAMVANFNKTDDSLPPMGFTENMSATFLSTGNPCLDFFFHVVPDTPANSLIDRLSLAWNHNPLMTLKLICNLRGVRGTGKSDKEGYYTAALWLYNFHPKTLAGNIPSIADFGYFKDLPEILYRLLEGSDVRKNQKNEWKRRGLSVRHGRFKQEKPKTRKKEIQSSTDREANISKAMEKSRIEKEKASGERKLRKVSMARKVMERFQSDSNFQLLHDRISDFFTDCLKSDLQFMNSGDFTKISLAAKWCPSIDSSFDRSTLLCESIARKIFPRELNPEYKEIEEAHYAYRVRDRLRTDVLVPLRKVLELPEVFIGANRWDSIPYNRVASVAMKNYKEKFMKHDGERFAQYLKDVKDGKTKIAAGALLPHEIILSLFDGQEDGGEVAELQWKRMVDDLLKKGKLRECIAGNTQLTKKLDCSRVFTEILSHIKGDPRAIDASDGKLSKEDYLLLSQGRTSSLTRQERETIYEIFQSYEKLKMENREFDLGDFVIDLHHRLRTQGYEGDEMDFIYIDEVQDLSMSQLALFSYVCRNVEEGFVFSGDTAQTIARGIDFRFQDIRSLFYKKFVLPKIRSGGREREGKGHISEIFHLSQNFRTHAGVLNLSQSVIDLLYHFFPQSIDILKPETSRISGESPVLLECGNNENAIKMIFGNRSKVGSMEGFGAEQVILVRDESAQKEILNIVGKKALVLTILECKGLEFQDVLLYNFFGSSPLKNKWRVIYNYMEELGMLDSNLDQSIPQFSMSKHNILCSELKQLYVAVTRTRQRLWFCEDTREHSEPLFDYWKGKCVVQVQQLNDSLAQSMLASSSREDWRSQGFKLYHEGNYKMATMCFERAEDDYWEKRSKASGLRAFAEHIHKANPVEANSILREAAVIYEAIGKADSAAQCLFDIGEFERAGVIFEDNCRKLERAGECFHLAKCYDRAADVYARGNFFSACLNVCSEGKLFDIGLRYILSWKQDAGCDHHGFKSKKIENLEQEFLEKCALHFHYCKDSRSMMKSVKSFRTVDLMRGFLKSLNCLDELLLLEEELGNFLEAVKIAKSKGDLLHVVDLLGKAGNFSEASKLLVQYVLANSLWSPGCKGWPLKQFKQKEELLKKAKFLAENDSKKLYDYTCTEADVISNENVSLEALAGYLTATKNQKSFRGEMICLRKMLDVHLNTSKYTLEDELVSDLTKHSKEVVLKNQVSLETLVYFWHCWKDRILSLLESLTFHGGNAVDIYPYNEFCLDFFGVWRLNNSHILLNSNADWAKNVDERFFHRNGKLVSIDAAQFYLFSKNYWTTELRTSGLKVLEKLDCLYKFSNKCQLTTFHLCRLLSRMFEVAKFLLETTHLNHGYHDKQMLLRFYKLATGEIQSHFFPPDCQVSLKESLICLRLTDVCQNMMTETIMENVQLTIRPTYGKIGRVAMLILGSRKLDKKLCKSIFNWLRENYPWSSFIQELCNSKSVENEPRGNLAKEMALVWRFHEALRDMYNANWVLERDYISPFSFMYLVERLLIMVSSMKGYFITTKFSFIEWLICHEENSNLTYILGAQTQHSFQATVKFLANILQHLLFDVKTTKDWTRKTHPNLKEYYPILVRRLVAVTCLLNLNFGICFDVLRNLLGRNYITDCLPSEFCDALGRKNFFCVETDKMNKFAGFFKAIGNPMVIVSSGGDCKQFKCRDATHVNLKISRCINDIMKVLFPKEAKSMQIRADTPKFQDVTTTTSEMQSSKGCDPGEVTQLPSSSLALDKCKETQEMKSDCENEGNLPKAAGYWEMFEALTSVDEKSKMWNASKVKMDVDKWVQHLTAAKSKAAEKEVPLEKVDGLLNELCLLSTALSMSKPEENATEVISISKSLYGRRTELGSIFSNLLSDDPEMEVGQMSGIKNAEGDENVNPDCNDESPEECREVEAVKALKVEPVLPQKGKGKGKNKPKKKKKSGRK